MGCNQESFVMLIVWWWHKVLSGSLPNNLLYRVQRRLGWELFTLPSYMCIIHQKTSSPCSQMRAILSFYSYFRDICTSVLLLSTQFKQKKTYNNCNNLNHGDIKSVNWCRLSRMVLSIILFSGLDDRGLILRNLLDMEAQWLGGKRQTSRTSASFESSFLHLPHCGSCYIKQRAPLILATGAAVTQQ